MPKRKLLAYNADIFSPQTKTKTQSQLSNKKNETNLDLAAHKTDSVCKHEMRFFEAFEAGIHTKLQYIKITFYCSKNIKLKLIEIFREYSKIQTF